MEEAFRITDASDNGGAGTAVYTNRLLYLQLQMLEQLLIEIKGIKEEIHKLRVESNN